MLSNGIEIMKINLFSGFCWVLGVMFFFGVLFGCVFLFLMLSKKLADREYEKAKKNGKC